MIDYARCPFCGGEMLPRVEKNKLGHWQMYCICLRCEARSPLCIFELNDPSKREETINRAQKRWQEPNRVLTLEDFDQDEKAVWVEDAKGSVILTIMRYIVLMNKPAYLAGCDFESDTAMFETKTYGRKWRSWLRKPTDEERAAMPWKEG